MQERTLETLIVENEDYFFSGELSITNQLKIKNGNLIVTGTLFCRAHVAIENGNIIVSETIEIQDEESDFVIEKGSISCNFLYVFGTVICIKDGNIYVSKDLISDSYILCDGNIEVKGYCDILSTDLFD